MLQGFAIILVVDVLLCQTAHQAMHDTESLYAAAFELLQQLPARDSMHLACSRGIHRCIIGRQDQQRQTGHLDTCLSFARLGLAALFGPSQSTAMKKLAQRTEHMAHSL